MQGCCVLHAAFPLHRGNPRVETALLFISWEACICPPTLKMMLNRLGLAVAFLVVGVPSRSSRWMVVLRKKIELESAYTPEDSREKKREGKMRN